jgi:hypothetical protein
MQPISENQSAPSLDAAPDETAASPETVVRLWQPGEVAIASLLLGFPGGFGLFARNAYRLGRRRTAYLSLLLGAGILVFLVLLPIELPTSVSIGLNAGIVTALFFVIQRQVHSASRSGMRVDRASGGAGLATVVGGWLVTAAPALVLLTARGFVGAQAQEVLAGTMAFGSAGTGCNVDAPVTTLTADQPLHYVAYFTRVIQPGETIDVELGDVASGETSKKQLTVNSRSDCFSGTVPAGTLAAGTLTFEFSVGTEQVAERRLTIAAP